MAFNHASHMHVDRVCFFLLATHTIDLKEAFNQIYNSAVCVALIG